jgi:hypothetical protein
MEGTYQEFQDLPAYALATSTTGTNVLCWSNGQPPPPIGAWVHVRMNRIGPAVVEGYFSLEGWLGLRVRPLSPPAWFIQQNGYNAIGHVFGAEVERMAGPPPMTEGPTQAELAALQAYAARHGRAWKARLAQDWQTGKDLCAPEGPVLRAVRNQRGPAWLRSRENGVAPCLASCR